MNNPLNTTCCICGAVDDFRALQNENAALRQQFEALKSEYVEFRFDRMAEIETLKQQLAEAGAAAALLVKEVEGKCPWDHYDPPSASDWPTWCKINTDENGDFASCSGEGQYEKCWIFCAGKKEFRGEVGT